MTKLEIYRAYARFVKRMLLLGGIYPTNESTILYRQLPVLTLLTSFVMFYGVTRFCLYNFDNLSVFTKSLSLVGSFSLMIVKVKPDRYQLLINCNAFFLFIFFFSFFFRRHLCSLYIENNSTSCIVHSNRCTTRYWKIRDLDRSYCRRSISFDIRHTWFIT